MHNTTNLNHKHDENKYGHKYDLILKIEIILNHNAFFNTQ